MIHIQKASLLSLAISLLIIISGCKNEDGLTSPQNHLPKIESLSANSISLLVNTETVLNCVVSDEDGDNLTITWTSKRGTFSNGVTGNSVKWIAPSTAGKDTLIATVNDGKNTIQGKVIINVGVISASPVLISPANNSSNIDLSPIFSWNAVEGATSYSLQVSVNDKFSSIIYSQSMITFTSNQIADLKISTTYYWRVSSSSIYGTSDWSSAYKFNSATPPQAPTLLGPGNEISFLPTTEVLSWSSITNARSYTLQVSTSELFSSFVFNQSGLTSRSQALTGLATSTKYFWRVSATNDYGTSNWSDVFSFTTISSEEIIGSWKLTMLTTTINGQPTSMTPEVAGTQITIVCKKYSMFQMTTIDAKKNTVIDGLWIVADKQLTFIYSDNTKDSYEYSLNGNVLLIKKYPYVHPTFGPLLCDLTLARY